MKVYPIHSDGGVDDPIPVTCCDVSQGGLGLVSKTSLPTKYAYVAFPDVPATVEHAILIRLMRVRHVSGVRHYGAQFRTDL